MGHGQLTTDHGQRTLFSRPEFEIEVAGRKVMMGVHTLIMGVLNVTPDSFSDGGRYFDPIRAIKRGVELVRQGADWIDVGGESTRPGVPISIDTTKAEVAEQALEAGAHILNDISGLRFEPRLAQVAKQFHVPLILMHTRGTPATMQRQPFARNIWRSLINGLETSIRRALHAGVDGSQLILDPGLGFGKPRCQSYEILAGLEKLQRFHLPILIGASRKSFVQAIVAGEGLDPLQAKRPGDHYWPLAQKSGKATEVPRTGRVQNSTLLATGDAAVVTAAILGGAQIVRVHDPAAILPAVRVADALLATRR